MSNKEQDNYEILGVSKTASDDERTIYDRYGHEGLKNGESGSSVQGCNCFSDFRDGVDPFKQFESLFQKFEMDDDDELEIDFGRKGSKKNSNNSQRSPFGFGGFGGFGGFDDDEFMGMEGGSFQSFYQTSISTSTAIQNGRKVTVTKKITTKADGTTEVVETIDNDGRKEEKRYQLENGQKSIKH